MNDDELLGALGDALAPPDRPVPADGLAAVRAQASAASAGPPAGSGAGASRRTVLVGSIAAAVGAAAGIAGTVAATAGDRSEDAGPPTRPVAFGAVPDGTTVTGRTIDHTWGMELLLDVDGLPVDRDFVVSYRTASSAVSAGGFRSVAVPMACRFNGTVLRDAVTEIVIADQESGEVVLRGRPV